MSDGLELLSQMEYPGRILALGRTDVDKYLVLYAITGRSPSSQARTLKKDKDFEVVRTKVTDYKILEEGSPSLLVYPAIFAYQEALAASNGFQTNLIYTALRNRIRSSSPELPANILDKAFREPFFVTDEKYGWIDITKNEPDKPNFTSRISGLIMNDHAGFHIARNGKPSSIIQMQLESGMGWYISTYNGRNTEPLLPFNENPRKFEAPWNSPEAAANDIYFRILKYIGKMSEMDFRVAVSAVFYDPRVNFGHGKLESFEINRHDLEAKK